MAETRGLNRRTFLRSAGMTALVGAAGLDTKLAHAAASEAFGAPLAGEGMFDFDTPFNRVGTGASKWDGVMAQYPGETILNGMGTADLDFRAAPCITKAIAEQIKTENWGYYSTPDKFYTAIAGYNKKRYNLDIDPKAITLVTGVHDGIIAAMQAFAPPGSRVLLLTPAYSGFYGDVRYTKTVAEECQLRFSDGKYSIDFDAFDKAAARSNVFIFCNPHNPTGNNWSQEDCMRLGEICLRHRIPVLSDEIHCDFIAKGQKYTPWASLPNKEIVNNSFTFKSTSKSFGMPGHKVAWYFSTNPDYLAKARANTRAGITTIGLAASHAALTEGHEWMDQANAYTDKVQEFSHSFIKANFDPQLLKTTMRAQGTYLLWLDVTGLAQKINAKQKAMEKSNATGKMVTPEQIVNDWFVHNAHVHMNAGSSYGLGGENHIRMNIGVSQKMAQQALTAMAAAVKKA